MKGRFGLLAISLTLLNSTGSWGQADMSASAGACLKSEFSDGSLVPKDQEPDCEAVTAVGSEADSTTYWGCKEMFPHIFDGTESKGFALINSRDKFPALYCNAKNSGSMTKLNSDVANCLAIRAAAKHLTHLGYSVEQDNARYSNRNNYNGNGQNNQQNDNGLTQVGNYSCTTGSQFILDQPACQKFLVWYQALMLGEQGMQMYNQVTQSNSNAKAQEAYAQSAANGSAQTAGLDAAASGKQSEARAADVVAAVQFTKASAITAQLATFPTPENVGKKCEEDAACCTHLGNFENANAYFPNGQLKAQMMADIAAALGNMAVAKLAADAARKQAGQINALKTQMLTDQAGTPDGGIMGFCEKNPQDSRCATIGGLTSIGGAGTFGGPTFGVSDGGSIDFSDGASNGDGVTGLGDGATVGQTTSIANAGGLTKAAADAKDVFNAPSAGGGSGKPAPAAAAGGASGGSVSAATPTLSKDAGAEGPAKPAEIKIGKENVGYVGGAYNGTWKPGSTKQKGADANPFAALLEKKDRDIAAESLEIKSDTSSSLFTDVSKRYFKVMQEENRLDVPK